MCRSAETFVRQPHCTLSVNSSPAIDFKTRALSFFWKATRGRGPVPWDFDSTSTHRMTRREILLYTFTFIYRKGKVAQFYIAVAVEATADGRYIVTTNLPSTL